MELRTYWEILWRRKWIFIASLLLTPLFTYILMSAVSPIYKSEAKLWININSLQQKFIKDVPPEFGKFEFTDNDNAMGTIEAMIESSPVIGRVIADMRLKDKKGDLFREADFVNPNIFKILLQKKGVGIENTSDTDTFEVKGYSDKLHEAKEIAERVIKAFLNLYSSKYKGEAQNAKRVMEYRLKDLRKKLNEAEHAVAHFKETNNVYNIDAQVTTLLTDISTLESEKNKTVRSLEEAKLSLKNIKEAPWIAEQVDFKNIEVNIERSAALDDHKKQLSSLETDLAKLKVERTREHPDVKIVEKQIQTVKGNIKREISRLYASQITGRDSLFDRLTEKYADHVTSLVELTVREKICGEQIKERQKMLGEIPAKERKLNELTREVDNLKSAYSSLSISLETTKSVLKMELANVFVVQSPRISGSIGNNLYFPPYKKTSYLMLATFVGIFVGICLVFLSNYVDDSIWSVQELEKGLNEKVIGTIPKSSRWRLNIRRIEKSSIIDSVYNLLANMKLFRGDELGKFISIVSPMKREGKSVLASLMSSTLAQRGKRVLLIDGNLRRPSLHHLFDLSNERGLSDYLLDDVLIEEIISPTSIRGLDVITSGEVPTSAQKYLDSDKLSALVKTLMTNYDIILFDTPAFVNGSDALVISKRGAEIIFVVEQGKTPYKKAQHFMEVINRAKISVLGVVLNKVKYP